MKVNEGNGMNKTTKIAEMLSHGSLYYVIKTQDGINPYRVYKRYFENGWHRKLVAKYADMKSAMYHMYCEA